MVHGKVEHNNNHDVHKVVANQDAGKQALGLVEKVLNATALSIVLDAFKVLAGE